MIEKSVFDVHGGLSRGASPRFLAPKTDPESKTEEFGGFGFGVLGFRLAVALTLITPNPASVDHGRTWEQNHNRPQEPLSLGKIR